MPELGMSLSDLSPINRKFFEDGIRDGTLDDEDRLRYFNLANVSRRQAASKRPSELEEAVPSLKRGLVSGFTGLADLVAMPTLAPLFREIVPERFRKDLPSSFTQEAENLGLPPRPETTAGIIAEGVSGAVAFGGPGILKSAATTAAAKGPGLISRFFGGAKGTVAPTVRVGTEGAAGGAGAAGGESLGEELDIPGLGVVGALGGGLGAGVVTNSLGAFGSEARRFVSPKSLQEAGKEMLADQITDLPSISKRAIEGQRLNAAIPQLEIRLPELAPGMQAVEQRLALESPLILGERTARIQRSQDALAAELERISPGGVGALEDAADAARSLQRQGDEATFAAQQQATQGVEEVTASIAQRVGDDTSLQIQRVANNIRERVATNQLEQGRKAGDLFTPIDDVAELIDLSQLDEAATTLRSGPIAGERVLPKGILKDIKRLTDPKGKFEGGPVPLTEVRALQKSIMFAIRKERAKIPVDNEKLANLGFLDKVTDGLLDQVQVPDAFRRLYSDARTAWRRFRTTFSKGSIGKLDETGPTGASRMTDANVVNLYVNAADEFPQRYRELIEAVGPDDAQALMTEVGFVSLARLPDKAKVRAWMNRNQDLMNAAPEVKQAAANLLRSTEALKSAGVSAPIAQLDNRVARGLIGNDPEQAITAALQSNDPAQVMAQIRAVTTGNEPAFRGFSRALWDELLQRGGVQFKGKHVSGIEAFVDPDRLLKVVEKNAVLLEKFYGAETFKRLRDVAEGSAFFAGSTAKITPRISLPVLGLEREVSRTTSRAFAIFRHAIGVPFVVTTRIAGIVATRLESMGRKQVTLFLDNVLHSPELLKQVTNLKDARGASIAMRAISSWVQRHSGVAAPALQSFSSIGLIAPSEEERSSSRLPLTARQSLERGIAPTP